MGDACVPGGGAYADSAVGGCASTGDGDLHLRFLPCYQVRGLAFHSHCVCCCYFGQISELFVCCCCSICTTRPDSSVSAESIYTITLPNVSGPNDVL